MSRRGVVPDKDALRHAVQWLGEQGRCTPALIEEASRRFDLSPLDEEFLLRHFLVDAEDEKRGHS